MDVVGHRLPADEHDRLSLPGPLDRVIGGEHDLATSGAGRCGQTPGGDRDLFPVLGIEAGRKQLVQRLGVHEQDRFLRRDELLVHEIGRDHDGRIPRPLAAPRLEHEEMLVLNGELEVLDVLVVALEPGRNLPQLFIGFGHHLLELVNGLRRAYAGDHVFALRVDEELPVELLAAGCGVTREPDPRAGAVARVAEHHHLDVHRGADVIGYVVDAAVLDRARIVPRSEHRIACHGELLLGLLGEQSAAAAPDDLLVTLDHLAERALVQIGVEPHAASLLHLLEFVLERIFRDFEDHVSEHLDESAVAVEGKTAIRRAPLQPFDRLVVEAQIQDRVHHPGHRELRARAHRYEQRVVGRPELRASGLFEPCEVVVDLAIDVGRDPGLLPVIDVADLGRNREPGRHRQSGVGHLGETRAFAPEQILHLAASIRLAIAEEIHVLHSTLQGRPHRCPRFGL